MMAATGLRSSFMWWVLPGRNHYARAEPEVHAVLGDKPTTSLAPARSPGDRAWVSVAASWRGRGLDSGGGGGAGGSVEAFEPGLHVFELGGPVLGKAFSRVGVVEQVEGFDQVAELADALFEAGAFFVLLDEGQLRAADGEQLGLEGELVLLAVAGQDQAGLPGELAGLHRALGFGELGGSF